MNEYIIWSKFHKNFTNDLIISGITINEALEENEDYIFFRYIGLKDREGNKIYADSSIVNIEYSDYMYKNNITTVGYFTENKEKHCLEFVTENKGTINFIEHISGILFLRIVDTIQENRLGLIK